MRPWFEEKGHPLPDKIMAAVGWPKRAKSLGECFAKDSTEDETIHIFITPKEATSIRVLDILLHELCHATLGHDIGHKGPFVKLARDFGLKGKPTATYAEEGSELFLQLHNLLPTLGQYPHSPIVKGRMKSKPPGGGWLKYVSPEKEEYAVRISPKVLEADGAPTDPWGNTMTEAEAE